LFQDNDLKLLHPSRNTTLENESQSQFWVGSGLAIIHASQLLKPSLSSGSLSSHVFDKLDPE